MNNKYRLFRRASGVYYIQDNQTGAQQSLRTKDRSEANGLFAAKIQAHQQPAFNHSMARVYLMASDQKMAKRTWQEVMEAMVALKKGETKRRWTVAIKDKCLDPIRSKVVVETFPEAFLAVLSPAKVSTNVYLRRIHNFAMEMDWLLKSIIPKRQWPKIIHKAKRAITIEEHQRIVQRETNPERRAFYQLCWHLGGSQGDVAKLTADDIDWADKTVCYNRQKLQHRQGIKPPLIHFGSAVEAILRNLPQTGPLFPYLRTVRPSDRATEFKQRCAGLGISGVSLHSYRHAWAERARKAGYPLRFAQEALGHNSKAVHRAYAKQAEVRVPCLEDWESKMKGKIVPLSFEPNVSAPVTGDSLAGGHENGKKAEVQHGS